MRARRYKHWYLADISKIESFSCSFYHLRSEFNRYREFAQSKNHTRIENSEENKFKTLVIVTYFLSIMIYLNYLRDIHETE